MIDKQELNRLEEKLRPQMTRERHITEAADRICMAIVRTNASLKDLLDQLDNGTAFEHNVFLRASSGNIYNYVESSLRAASKYFVDITAGGNGGMASIGRGEFFAAFLSNFKITISKSGKGDWELPYGKFEEVKFNGGKVNVDAKRGLTIQKEFKTILNRKGNVQYPLSKDYVPFRKEDQKNHSKDIPTLNAYFWEAISGTVTPPLTNQELRDKSIERAFHMEFQKSDSIIIIDENGNFVRFWDSFTASRYYQQKGNQVKFEYRAKQNNPFSIYLFT